MRINLRTLDDEKIETLVDATKSKKEKRVAEEDIPVFDKFTGLIKWKSEIKRGDND